ncbi:MAG: hypothetical protein JSR92_20205 [Proteobacteria bacterium]|nr:hypothetical protein [Pseudomonadota bacterium]
MHVSFELWQLITLAMALIGAFVGLGKLLMAQFARNVQRALEQIQSDSGKWHELELKFYQHLAELPVAYVRREDYVRGQTVIEAKLDAIASEVKSMQIERRKA